MASASASRSPARSLVLALDEPTNHLDAPTRALVAQALASFKGVGLLVSHDRALLDELVQSCVFVEAGRALAIPGTYTQARRELELRQDTVRTEPRQARGELARIKAESVRRDGVAARSAARRSARHLDRHDRDGRAKIKLAVYTGQDGKAGKLSSQMDKRIGVAEKRLEALDAKKERRGSLELDAAPAPRKVLARLPAGSIPLGPERMLHHPELYLGNEDRVGLVGKNGAGKSTVMKMVCGLATPTEGEIELFGERAGTGSHAGPGRRSGGEGAPRIGALIEAPGIVGNLTAYENLMAKALAMGVVDAPARCRETLALVGLPDTGKKKAHGFSLGMKQRLGLALALIGSPDLLLLDEPLNGLDPEGTRAMRNLLVRLNDTLGVTIVISSHVLDQLDRVATRFGVIANGTMVREMTAEQVQAECGDTLRVRTADPARTLALLEEALPHATFRAEPDGSLAVAGADQAGVAQVLRVADQLVLELSEVKRDIEDYFVELMEGGAHHA